MAVSDILSRLPSPSSSADWLRTGWDLLKELPRGRLLYSRFLATAIPYAASVDARVVELEKGFGKVELHDERRVRNHLGSLHAMALAHVAELAGNAALAYSLPEGMRFIVTEFSMRYLKKAHGTISATCRCPVSFTNERQEIELKVELHDSQANLVAEVSQKVLIGPMPAPSGQS
jgi:uncharacterized protein (TIGR00369 family)